MGLMLGMVGWGIVPSLRAQPHVQDYLREYAPLAIEEMQRYKIPASITLAQGMLESSYGRSRLATEANNHFGIKCPPGWSGPSMRHDDDRPKECFKAYSDPEGSYRDHSLFLTERARYAELFALRPDDYKGWAKGLSKAGYATHPKYASLLIELIERYGLDSLDRLGGERQRYRSANGVAYTLARPGDGWETLADWAGMRPEKLRDRNDAPEGSAPEPGTPVYLKKKKKKAAEATHTLEYGETVYGVSQRYAVRLDALLEYNGLHPADNPPVGTVLRLR